MGTLDPFAYGYVCAAPRYAELSAAPDRTTRILVGLRPVLTLVAGLHLAACAPLPGAAAAAVPGQIVVRFAPDADPAGRAAAREAAGVRAALALGPDAERWTVADAGGAIAAAQAAPAVAFAHANHRRQLFATGRAPVLSLLSLPEPLAEAQWHLPAARFPSAWTLTRGAGILVAVIDSGVDPDHPDLKANLLPAIDEVAATGKRDLLAGEAYDGRDSVGHGTHVAGLIAAVGDNGVGGSGGAPAARILPIKVTPADGYSDDATIAKGIVDAVAGGARILNLSIGGEEPSPLLLEALNDAIRAGALPVIASGNNGGPVNFPAAYAGMVSVGATTIAGKVSRYSSGGTGLVLVAPGGGRAADQEGARITSTLPTYPSFTADAIRLEPGYGGLSGTSMAAPLVSAAAALLLARFPALSPVQLRTRLAATAVDGGEPGWDGDFGYGNLDAAAALREP